MSEFLRISRDENVATVTLQRPDKHNALNLELIGALAEAGLELGADKSVRVIILEGDGPSFCAGIDLGVLQDADTSLSPEMLQPVAGSAANFFQRAAYVWREVPVPVICAMHGNVFGAGLQVALGADLRYASADCQLSVMEIKWGIIPDLALSKTLTRLVAADKAKELAWTGRMVAVDEAVSLGIVTAKADDPKAAARDTAAVIASRSPSAIRAIKQLLDESAELSVAEALQLEARLQLSLLGRPQQREAVAANLQNRQPDFED
jgi:enoyl-CoA hydratase/carnithine racemase